MEFVRYNDKDIKSFVYKLYSEISDSKFNPDVLIGIGSGGFIVLRLLLDCFRGAGDDKSYLPIAASRYTKIHGGKKLEISRTINDINLVTNKKVLIVDDVADEGETFKGVLDIYRSYANEIKIASLDRKTSSIVTPDFYVNEVDPNIWIIYPWEVYETIREFCYEKDENGNEIRLKSIREILNSLSVAGILPKELGEFREILPPDDPLVSSGIINEILAKYKLNYNQKSY